MKILLSAFILLLGIQLSAQELINGTYVFQTDPVKKYSIYVPSSYVEGTPNDMMLGLHPWNTSRWNANSWCDTLKTFAEANNLLLVCPDGGNDGKVDDAIDTAFTTFLIDEARLEYTINDEQIYAIGFSWGAKTVYTYGLQHADRFAGFIPVGAAVTSSEVAPHVNKAADKKFYVIHGSQDNPGTRYTPIINMLDGPHCVESKLLQGVGHDIDFPNRNTLLTEALQHIKSTSCGVTSAADESLQIGKLMSQNTYKIGEQLKIEAKFASEEFNILTVNGQLVSTDIGTSLKLPNTVGQYVLVLKSGQSQQFVIMN